MDTTCFEKIGLFFTARDLPKLDLFSHTDAFVVVNIIDPKTSISRRMANTSVIKDTENPDWPDQIMVDYHFEETQVLHIQLYDQDAPDINSLSKHDFIGEMTFTLSKLMCAPGQRVTGNLIGGKNKGTLVVRGEVLHNTRDLLIATFAGKKLVNKDGFFGKSDPFIIIHRQCEDGSFMQVWKNAHIDNNLNPTWPVAKLPILNLCNGDLDRPLKIEIWDNQSNGKHQYMGSFKTSLNELLTNQGTPLNIIEEDKKQKKSGYVNSGTFTANNVIIERHPTLQEYIIGGGCELSLMVAIDFTGSNGDPSLPSSLHYIDRTGAQLNQYQSAILTIGNIVQEYDTDKLFPVYGFGCKVRMPNNRWTPVQHSFPVYGGGVEAQGVEGILRAYTDCLPNVALSGPTLLAPIIKTAAERAVACNCNQTNQKYNILLILTDGVINDEEQSIAAIVEASYTPLSIIIIGVGPADFSSMRILDGDNGLLKVPGGRTAARDIVQFVAFQEFLAKGPIDLASEVLREIPAQLLGFMAQRKIVPNPPRL